MELFICRNKRFSKSLTRYFFVGYFQKISYNKLIGSKKLIIFWRSAMEIKKKLIGNHLGFYGETQYYLLQKDTHFGIELLEGTEPNFTSTIEWFSENQDEACCFIKLLCQHGASSIHLDELIDNYIV